MNYDKQYCEECGYSYKSDVKCRCQDDKICHYCVRTIYCDTCAARAEAIRICEQEGGPSCERCENMKKASPKFLTAHYQCGYCSNKILSEVEFAWRLLLAQKVKLPALIHTMNQSEYDNFKGTCLDEIINNNDYKCGNCQMHDHVDLKHIRIDFVQGQLTYECKMCSDEHDIPDDLIDKNHKHGEYCYYKPMIRSLLGVPDHVW